MPQPKVAIIDFFSLLYRAFFALPTTLTTKEGVATNAVYGFTQMLLKLLDDEQPEYLIVATDMPEATFRHEAFEDYKAHRKPMPDEMRPQIAMMMEMLDAMHIPVFGVAGFEADDVIGTLARRAAVEGHDALIVTSDRDALQLVDDRIHVLATKKGITETVTYDTAGVIEKYGVAPEQVPDIKALTGDSSDNIPGVPGIGDKTASKLIAEFGSLENLLEHVDAVKGKVGQTLAAYAEQARSSKHLATIITDVPLDGFTWDCCRRQAWDQARLLELVQRFDFRSLLVRLKSSDVTAAAAAAPVSAEPMGATRIVKSSAEVARLVKEITVAGACTLIPVSDGPSPIGDRLAGLAISTGADCHVYLPLRDAPPMQASLFGDELAEPTSGTLPNDCLRALAAVLENAEISKSGYHLKPLLLWLRREEITLRGATFDAQLAAYLIDPTARHGLADLALDYLQLHLEIPELTLLWCAGDLDALATAVGNVAQLIRRLETPLRTRLASGELMPLFRDVEMPLIAVLAEMEWQGIALNTRDLLTLSDQLGSEIGLIEQEIYQLAGEHFTINSPKQLQQILFEKLNLPKGRKIKTGYSTDADTLAGLAEQHVIVRKILTYRELSKLKSTYVDSLPRLVNPRTGRVHTHFNQTVAATGRLSSHDPNLQNIPIRTEEGREIRRAFVPGAPGWVLVAADYSQIELRVLAHYTNDPALIEVFQRGEDLHTATACRVFGVTPDAVTRDMRRMAKVVNFSIPYGTTAFGLAGQLGSTREFADGLMKTYLARFPGVADYMQQIVVRARQEQYVTTLLGRRRPIPDINATQPNIRQAAERTAINTPIQGSAADIMKLAMLRLYAVLRARSELQAHLLLQVHDEMVMECPADEVEIIAGLLRDAMKEAYPPLIVPLEVEVKTGPNWRDVTPQVEDLPVVMEGE